MIDVMPTKLSNLNFFMLQNWPVLRFAAIARRWDFAVPRKSWRSLPLSGDGDLGLGFNLFASTGRKRPGIERELEKREQSAVVLLTRTKRQSTPYCPRHDPIVGQSQTDSVK
jgi:hypothetical protein